MSLKEKIEKIGLLGFALCCFFFSSCAKKEYHVGDIVMSGGSVLSKEKFLSYKGSEKPVAVIFTVSGVQTKDSKRVIGVGLFESAETISFAEDSSTGDNTNFLFNRTYVINQKFDISTGTYTNEGFAGDIDGEDSWKNVKRRDKTAKENMYSVYPAYAFAENYGISKKCGKFDTTDWYLPTAAELYEMFENKNLLNEVISACGGNELDHRIWSCSQDYYMKDIQLLIDMETGEIRRAFKDSKAHVRSVYCFANN